MFNLNLEIAENTWKEKGVAAPHRSGNVEAPQRSGDGTAPKPERIAVRAILYAGDSNRLLFEQTRAGDYKLPGGAVEAGENHAEALIREIREETGYTEVTVGPCVGQVTEESLDGGMISYYYLCSLKKTASGEDSRMGAEETLCQGVWMDVEEALAANGQVAPTDHFLADLPWHYREALVLRTLARWKILPLMMEVWQCGQLLLQADRSGMAVDVKEGRANFVTMYDKQVQQTLQERFRIRIPEAVFVGEEEDIHASIDRGFGLIVDPIDGTTNFMKDYHCSCISVGLSKDGSGYGGIVCNPYMGELFYAEQGLGAWVNGRQVHVSDRPLAEGIVLFGSSPYRADLTEESFRRARAYFEEALDLRRSGSAAWDLCCIAAGRAELYFECILSPWDYAAGSVLVTEAGGSISTLDEQPITLAKPCSILAKGAPKS